MLRLSVIIVALEFMGVAFASPSKPLYIIFESAESDSYIRSPMASWKSSGINKGYFIFLIALEVGTEPDKYVWEETITLFQLKNLLLSPNRCL